MYEFVFYILEGKLSKVANYVNVKAENIDEAYEKAEAKARRICKREGWTFDAVENTGSY